MAEQKVYNGYTYTQQPDGSWKRGAPVSQMPADPTFAYQGPKAAAEVANTQSTIADRAADNARAEETLRIQRAAEARAQAEWNAKFNPDGTPKVAPKRNNERTAQIKTVLDNIERLRSLSDKNLSVGSWSKYFQENPLLGQNRQNVEGAVDMVFGDLIQQQIAVLSEMNGNKGVATMANTQEEARRMAAAIANLSPDQSREEFLRGLKRAEDYYLRQAAQIEGTTPDNPKLIETYLPRRKRDDDPLAVQRPQTPDFAGGGDGEKSIPIPQQMQDEHAAFLRQNWGRIDPNAYANFRAGLDSKYGFTPDPSAYREVASRLNEWAMKGGRPDGLTIPPVNAKMDGLDQINASAFNNRLGGLMFGAGDQLGLADEMAGGVRSLINGTPYEVEVARANAMKQGMQDAYGTENLVGNIGGALLTGAGAAKAFPGLTGAFTGSTLRAIGTGAGFGALSGAGEMNDNRLGGAALGGGLGLAGGAAGSLAAPLIAKGMGTQAGQAASRTGRSIWNHTGGKVMPSMAVAPAPNVPQMGRGEGLLPVDVLQNAIPKLQDADAFGLPYALADADPKLRMLAGSVSRRSADARQLAESTFEPRARGQADRLIESIDTRLAPVTDINARSSDIMRGANIEAGPYYARAKAQPAMADPIVGSILNTSTGKEALKRAHRIASNERRDPTELGFIYDEATGGVRINDAGRYTAEPAPMTAPPPAAAMAAQTVPRDRNSGSWVIVDRETGQPVLETFQEGVAGKVNTARYEVLTANQWLGRINGQPNSGGRFSAASDPISEPVPPPLNGPSYRDLSGPAGPDVPFAPPSAYGKEVSLPTYETLHYVRQGFDDILDGYRDKVTGTINLDNEGRAIQNLRRDLSNRLQENADFRQGDAIYASGAKRRDALRDGFNILSRNNVPYRDFDARLTSARAYDEDFKLPENRIVPEMQRGFATAMADTANKMRLSGNPWESVYGAPNQQQKIAALFPDAAPSFGKIYGLERDMAKTAHETLGGSPTAARQAIDDQFDNGLLGAGTNLAADALGGGGMFTVKGLLGKGAQYVADTARLRGGKSKADAIAPVLFSPNPRVTLDYLEDLTKRQKDVAKRTGRYRRGGGLFGGILPSMVLGTE